MYYLNLSESKKKDIYPLGENFSGKSPAGESVDFTNYYLRKNGRPMFGISGEFHFSRCREECWEDELEKMRLCGINIIATYTFWNHHEEKEGEFCFEGRRNLRRFVTLCQEKGFYVIVRIGPFVHGEVRNGGLPDWLYGKPFEVRENNEGFLSCTRRLYRKLAEQLSGLFYQEGGPVIGVQIDNEYQHSAAPWEMTAGVTNEWISPGHSGEDYMYRLRDIAREEGIVAPFYTCTAWGGAVTPEEMMPLWGGYSYRPWIYPVYQGEHPATDEYIYADYHNNDLRECGEFKPHYSPENRPYACCEMGGGMLSTYYCRFQFAYKSVDAMANIKMASGCNFLGYYVFRGGTNPKGNGPEFLNEGQAPKLSYDYQAAVGEFGQLRESYKRLKPLHSFANEFSKELCATSTYLPEGARKISPLDQKTLRYAVRMKDDRGFLFINNFQDHAQTRLKKDETIVLELSGETIEVGPISLAPDENCILPFNMDLNGILLKYALAQPVTRWTEGGTVCYLFMVPDLMEEGFVFEEGTVVTESNHGYGRVYSVVREDKYCSIYTIPRNKMGDLYQLERGGRRIFVMTDAAVLGDKDEIRLETMEEETLVSVYPCDAFKESSQVIRRKTDKGMWGIYQISVEKKEIDVSVKQTGPSRYVINIPIDNMKGLKEGLLQIQYEGDIGQAFIDGEMIHDNFNNGAIWELGLKNFVDRLEKQPLTIYITPLKKGARVNVQSAMAARTEEVDETVASLNSAAVRPVYEVKLLYA